MSGGPTELQTLQPVVKDNVGNNSLGDNPEIYQRYVSHNNSKFQSHINTLVYPLTNLWITLSGLK